MYPPLILQRYYTTKQFDGTIQPDASGPSRGSKSLLIRLHIFTVITMSTKVTKSLCWPALENPLPLLLVLSDNIIEPSTVSLSASRRQQCLCRPVFGKLH